MNNPTIDGFRPLKDALGRYATGIAVASCRADDGQCVAMTVNSFTSVSLDPPLVLWCIEKTASRYNAFMEAEHYGISILNAEQQEISDRFARFTSVEQKGVEMEDSASGVPLLRSCLAAFDCRVVDRHEAGDHIILIGEVCGFRSEEGAPLIYFASQYGTGQFAKDE